MGLKILLSGASGTGKTMTAGVVARELGLDLNKIDLSGFVSKYIGETEKNLDRIFRAAQCGNAILFFDEADALLGKRSEAKRRPRPVREYRSRVPASKNRRIRRRRDSGEQSEQEYRSGFFTAHALCRRFPAA